MDEADFHRMPTDEGDETLEVKGRMKWTDQRRSFRGLDVGGKVRGNRVFKRDGSLHHAAWDRGGGEQDGAGP